MAFTLRLGRLYLELSELQSMGHGAMFHRFWDYYRFLGIRRYGKIASLETLAGKPPVAPEAASGTRRCGGFVDAVSFPRNYDQQATGRTSWPKSRANNL